MWLGSKKWRSGQRGRDFLKGRYKMKKRLEYLREQIKNENISYSEIVELQNLSQYIDKFDVELLQWAGVSEKEGNK